MKKLAFSVFAAALTFGANAAESVEVNATTDACCGFDGIYFGLGVAAVDGGIKFETAGGKLSDHSTRLAGTAALGYGRRIKEKAYLGLEAGLDATQNVELFGGMTKINGLTPSAALKLGFVHPETKSMVYLKAGAAYSKSKHSTPEIKCNKWAPIVALGGEKLCGKLRTRLEAEYRFRTNKSVEVGSDTAKLTNKGAITFRAMAIYTVGK